MKRHLTATQHSIALQNAFTALSGSAAGDLLRFRMTFPEGAPPPPHLFLQSMDACAEVPAAAFPVVRKAIEAELIRHSRAEAKADRHARIRTTLSHIFRGKA